MVLGRMMRAAAIMRHISNDVTGVAVPPSPMGVPGTATRALMGTDSGWPPLRVAMVWRRPTRSVSFSPRPRMPPVQTEMPAAWTFSIVARRSS